MIGNLASADILTSTPMSVGAMPRSSNRQLNVIISAWLCIALGSAVILYDGSAFSIALSWPLSIGGVILLILGIYMGNTSEESAEGIDVWEPTAMEMPDAGRPMYRIDTTLDEPVRTSILCGRCANIDWVEGRKPRQFRCPSCDTELWISEEE